MKFKARHQAAAGSRSNGSIKTVTHTENNEIMVERRIKKRAIKTEEKKAKKRTERQTKNYKKAIVINKFI